MNGCRFGCREKHCPVLQDNEMNIGDIQMDSQIKIAPCGLVCSRCDAYRATPLNDPEKLELVAAKWREMNYCDEIKAEYLPCDGCMSECGRKSFFCTNMCKIRSCIIQRGLQVCSDCPDYDRGNAKCFVFSSHEIGMYQDDIILCKSEKTGKRNT